MEWLLVLTLIVAAFHNPMPPMPRRVRDRKVNQPASKRAVNV